MPNHVESRITIAGSKEDIEKIINFVKGDKAHFDFNKIKPMPDHIDPEKGLSLEDHKQDNWYYWSVANWGTNWNCYDQNTDPETFEPNNSLDYIQENNLGISKIVEYYFSTAWSPATPVMTALSEKFPEIIIKYSFVDEGYNFAGTEYYHNGEIISEEDFDLAPYCEVEEDEEESQLESPYKILLHYGDSQESYNRLKQFVKENL